jgi:hypothetical protein
MGLVTTRGSFMHPTRRVMGPFDLIDDVFLRSNFVKGHEYLYLVENRWENGRTRQRVVYYFGRRDKVDLRAVLRIMKHFRGEEHLTPDQMRRMLDPEAALDS